MTKIVDKRVALLSPEDREALIKGQGFPSRRRRVSWVVEGVSQEADGLFTILSRAGGERSVRSLVTGTHMADVLSPAAAELGELGLVERVGNGADAMFRLTSAAEGVMLLSSWSMRG